jgi:hypothetical protein
MRRTGWTVLALLAVLALAWWGLRSLWWRMSYLVPAFGVGVLVGVVVTLWVVRRRT